jgi:hypothetical protein
MADNTQVNQITTGGDTIATEDVGGIKYQLFKRAFGIHGAQALATSLYHAVAAASNNAANIKNSAAQLFAVHVFNAAGYPVYVKFYNKATAPAPASDTPVLTFGVQAGVSRDIPLRPAAFATGLGVAMVKNIGDSDNTSLAASDCVVDVEYL